MFTLYKLLPSPVDYLSFQDSTHVGHIFPGTYAILPSQAAMKSYQEHASCTSSEVALKYDTVISRFSLSELTV